MFLLEPPRTQYDVNFALAGVPVRVHPLFWLVTLLLGMSHDAKPVEVLLWVAAVFVSILVHEFGHAVMIRYYGWRPRIILHSLGGLAAYEPTYHRTWPQVAISFAGPAAGFLLAALVALAIRLAGHEVQLDWKDPFPLPIRFEFFHATNLNRFIIDLFFVNILWGCINLLPIYPLDGGQISQEVLNHYNPANGTRQSLMLSIFTAVGMGVVMLAKLEDYWLALLFGLFAYTNYQALQQYDDRFGGRGW
ncbi:MAG TPA: site-2 protease family protein [Pirellulales bacterium]|nr:site-2 protease family protein [Pirellulales bacterium]